MRLDVRFVMQDTFASCRHRLAPPGSPCFAPGPSTLLAVHV